MNAMKIFVVIVCCSDDEATDKLVSVQVDDEESMIQFIDIPGSEVCRISLSLCVCVCVCLSVCFCLLVLMSRRRFEKHVAK